MAVGPKLLAKRQKKVKIVTNAAAEDGRKLGHKSTGVYTGSSSGNNKSINKLGETILKNVPCSDFDTKLMPASLLEYKPENDPHLKNFFKKRHVKKNIDRCGLTTRSGHIKCSLKVINDYKEYVSRQQILARHRRALDIRSYAPPNYSRDSTKVILEREANLRELFRRLDTLRKEVNKSCQKLRRSLRRFYNPKLPPVYERPVAENVQKFKKELNGRLVAYKECRTLVEEVLLLWSKVPDFRARQLIRSCDKLMQTSQLLQHYLSKGFDESFITNSFEEELQRKSRDAILTGHCSANDDVIANAIKKRSKKVQTQKIKKEKGIKKRLMKVIAERRNLVPGGKTASQAKKRIISDAARCKATYSGRYFTINNWIEDDDGSTRSESSLRSNSKTVEDYERFMVGSSGDNKMQNLDNSDMMVLGSDDALPDILIVSHSNDSLPDKKETRSKKRRLKTRDKDRRKENSEIKDQFTKEDLLYRKPYRCMTTPDVRHQSGGSVPAQFNVLETDTEEQQISPIKEKPPPSFRSLTKITTPQVEMGRGDIEVYAVANVTPHFDKFEKRDLKVNKKPAKSLHSCRSFYGIDAVDEEPASSTMASSPTSSITSSKAHITRSNTCLCPYPDKNSLQVKAEMEVTAQPSTLDRTSQCMTSNCESPRTTPATPLNSEVDVLAKDDSVTAQTMDRNSARSAARSKSEKADYEADFETASSSEGTPSINEEKVITEENQRHRVVETSARQAFFEVALKADEELADIEQHLDSLDLCKNTSVQSQLPRLDSSDDEDELNFEKPCDRPEACGQFTGRLTGQLTGRLTGATMYDELDVDGASGITTRAEAEGDSPAQSDTSTDQKLDGRGGHPLYWGRPMYKCPSSSKNGPPNSNDGTITKRKEGNLKSTSPQANTDNKNNLNALWHRDPNDNNLASQKAAHGDLLEPTNNSPIRKEQKETIFTQAENKTESNTKVYPSRSSKPGFDIFKKNEEEAFEDGDETEDSGRCNTNMSLPPLKLRFKEEVDISFALPPYKPTSASAPTKLTTRSPLPPIPLSAGSSVEDSGKQVKIRCSNTKGSLSLAESNRFVAHENSKETDSYSTDDDVQLFDF